MPRDNANTTSAPAPGYRVSARQQRVLIVDDEEAIVELLCLLLEEEGLQVQGETDTVRAVSAIQRERPDLVITDLMMPKMTGVELAARASRIDPRIRVVYMSAVTEPPDGDDHEFLQKPFDVEFVVDTVFEQLGTR